MHTPLRTLALLCVVMPLVLYVIVGAYRFHQIWQENDVRLDRALRIAAEHAQKVLDTNEILLARAVDAVDTLDAATILQRRDSLSAQFAAIAANRPQINAIWVMGADGRALISSRGTPLAPELNVSDRDYFIWHRQNPGNALYISRPLAGRLSERNIMLMSRGLTGPDGRFAGVATISLLPPYIEGFHRDLVADEPGLAITTLHENGGIYTRWPPLANAPPSLSPNSPVMSRIRAGDASGRMRGVSSVDGRDRLLQFTRIGNYPIYLGTGMDVRDIELRWMGEMGWFAAFGLPPLLGLLFALRVALRRTREVLHAAERLNQETLALRRVEETLLQSQKLEALGRLTGGVAHDFNNALMVISNNVFILKRRLPDVDSPELASIGRAVASATKLTRQLLGFSRRQALVPEYCRLQDRLPHLGDLLKPVLGAQIRLLVEVAPDTHAIRVDSAEFELALINLAINARDAMPSAGVFSVRASNVDADLPPPLVAPMVLIHVTDNGHGIAPENLSKVFEPFFTTKPVGEGTGLGLSQVYGFCQRAGGQAIIESELGGGTRIRLYFPAALEPQPAPGDSPSAEIRPTGKRVLLVEDNDEVAMALRQVLESMGCTVNRLDRGAAAREWLLKQAVPPDVVLSDVVMPGEMDGVAVAQFVRARFPAVQVVLMTGYAEQLEAITGLGFDIIPKPCSAETLARSLLRPPQPAAS